MAHGTCKECTHAEDRKQWKDGPWMNEPDRVDFSHAGFNCLLHRSHMGNWCGYVGVRPDHPVHGKGYDDISVSVHGGLTYSEKCCGAICHVPQPGEPDELWWLGFDCAHGFDLLPYTQRIRELPGFPKMSAGYRDVYRDMAYVRKETESLAEQLAAMQPVQE